MDITLVYKWDRDPDEIFVREDGSTKLRRDRLVASDDDAAAAACARALAGATGGKVAGATIGSGDVSWAMARGAECAINAKGLMPSLDERQTAESLAAAVRAAGDADFVVMGNSHAAAGVAGALAALLDLPLVVGIQDAEPDSANPGCVIAHRKTSSAVETLGIAGPALIAVSAVESEKNVPGMKQMLAAKKAPVHEIDGQTSPECAVSAIAHRCPELHRARIFEGPQAARELIATLRADQAI